jgi:heme/copper-type cytochrome/quinol oxidase subunit 2
MLSWLPENVSTYGPEIDRLFYLIYYVTGATFFAVQITLLVFLVVYRHRDDRRAAYTHGNTTLEIAWTVAPAILLVILAFASRSVWAEIKQRVPPSDIQVQVTAKQFNWEIAYPGPDGKLGTDDDVTMDNDLYVPVGKTVRMQLKSRDVIHSFFIPSPASSGTPSRGTTSRPGSRSRRAANTRSLRRALRLRPFRHEGVAPRPATRRVRDLGPRAQRRPDDPAAASGS